MTIKKCGLHCLLALCIGLLPALNVSAMSIEHAGSMPTDCVDCGGAETSLDDFCADQDCHSITASCGNHANASYLLTSALPARAADARSKRSSHANAHCRQGVTDSIFRPPIA